MKNHAGVAAAFLAALLSGCAGTSPTRIIGDTVGAAGGAVIGAVVGEHNPLAAAAGAGVGLIANESLQAGSNAAANKSYAAGYEKGRSDSAKQRYQTLLDQQRQAAGADESPTLFDIPLPERTVGGAFLAPGTQTLRIQE